MSPTQPTPTASRLALAAALTATLALAACKRADDTPAPATAPAVVEPAPIPAPAPVTTAPSALNVSAVTLGTSVGADRRIATPMSTFTTSDPIVVSIDTSGAAANAELTARLVYQDGQTAGEQTERLTTSGNEITNVTFTNANGWPAGSYRAEIWVDGKQAQSRDFTVR